MQNREPLFHFWHNTLPAFFLRWWPLYGQALEEGYFFQGRPTLSALLPFVFIGLGFLTGAWHWGYRSVLTESLFLMIPVLLLSFFNGQWGALGWMGYCLGDFLLFRMHFITLPYQDIFSGIVKIGLPAIIYYILLAFLMIVIPLLAKWLTCRTLEKSAFQNNKIANAVLQGLLAGGFVYFWNQAYPLLIRPLWTWSGSNPTVQAIAPIQKTGWVLVLCAASASIAKVLLKDQMQKGTGEKVALPAIPKQRLIKIPVQIQILLRASFMMFLLSGLLLRWWDALILFLVLSLLNAMRSGLFFTLPSIWIERLQTIPLLLRLAGAIGVSWFLADLIHRALWNHSQETFLPIIVTFSLSLFLIYLVCPRGRHS